MAAAGAARLEGGAVAVLLEALGDPGRQHRPDFRLEAQAVSLQLDTADSSTAWAAPPERPDPDAYHEVRVTGVSNGVQHRVLVFPLPGHPAPRIQAAGACMQLAPSPEDVVERPPLVQPDAPWLRAGAASAVLWRDCAGDAPLTIEGDFVLALWDVAARVEAAEGSFDLRTGQHPNPMDPTGGMLYAGDQRTEAYLSVRDGVLTLPPHHAGHQAYLEAATAYAVTGVVDLGQPTGEVRAVGAQRQPFAAGMVLVTGNLTLHAAKVPGHLLHVEVAGDVTTVMADGRGLVPAATATTPGRPDLALAALLAGAVLAAGLALGAWMFPPWYYRQLQSGRGFLGLHRPVGRRDLRAMGYWAMARRCHDLGWHRSSLRLAAHGQRLAPHLLDHRLMRGLAYHSMRRWDQVLRCLAPVQPRLGSPHDRAATAMLLSEACVRLGDLEEAWLWCEAASEESPDVFRRELAHPVFDSLRGRAAAHRPAERDPSFA